jgi:phospholipase C
VAIHPPAYDLRTIFEVLQEHGVDWMVFFSDLPFPLVFPRLAQDAAYTARMRSLNEFLQRAQAGNLPSVSWLEPNFLDVPDGDAFANDDHPPGDVARGQRLVANVYNALAQGPAWSKTLLLITYDEHGGFFDHVDPPAGDAVADDNHDLHYYGLRVPTFLISAWVPRGSVAAGTYDHTSILATILRRFCAAPDGSVPSMGARADHAGDVGDLLSAATPRPSPPEAPVITPQPAPAITPPVTNPPLDGTTVTPPPEDAVFGLTLRRSLLGF